jgi:hypothetical protein
MSKSIIHIRSLLSAPECITILKSEQYGQSEVLLGDNIEMNVDVGSDILKRIEVEVNKNLSELRIQEYYVPDCTKIVHVQSPIPLHSDPVVMHDKDGNHVYTRHFVCVLYLTEFEMGEIMFPQHGKVIKPNRGDLVLFPTGPFYLHQVNVPLGERWILRVNFNYEAPIDNPY